MIEGISGNSISVINIADGNGLKFDGVNDYARHMFSPSTQMFSGGVTAGNFAYTIFHIYYNPSTLPADPIFTWVTTNLDNKTDTANTNGRRTFQTLNNFIWVWCDRGGVAYRNGIDSIVPFEYDKMYMTVFRIDGHDANDWDIWANGIRGKTITNNNLQNTDIFPQPTETRLGAFWGESGTQPSGFETARHYQWTMVDGLVSDSNIEKWFKGGYDPKVENCFFDYRFNQKQGDKAYDLSSNNIHLTLNNFGTTSDYGGGAWVDKNGNTAK